MVRKYKRKIEKRDKQVEQIEQTHAHTFKFVGFQIVMNERWLVALFEGLSKTQFSVLNRVIFVNL